MFFCRNGPKVDHGGHVGIVWYQNRAVKVHSWSKNNESKWSNDMNTILKTFSIISLYSACIFTSITHEKRRNSAPKLMLLLGIELTWIHTRFREMGTRTCDVITICVDGETPQQTKIKSFLATVVALSFTVRLLPGDCGCRESSYIKKRWATAVAQSCFW